MKVIEGKSLWPISIKEEIETFAHRPKYANLSQVLSSMSEESILYPTFEESAQISLLRRKIPGWQKSPESNMGEAESLIIAKERCHPKENVFFLTEDKGALRFSKEFNFLAIGTGHVLKLYMSQFGMSEKEATDICKLMIVRERPLLDNSLSAHPKAVRLENVDNWFQKL